MFPHTGGIHTCGQISSQCLLQMSTSCYTIRLLIRNYFKRHMNFGYFIYQRYFLSVLVDKVYVRTNQGGYWACWTVFLMMCLRFGDLTGFTEGGTGHFHRTRVDTSLASDLQGGTDHQKMAVTLEVDLAKCVSFAFKRMVVVLYGCSVVYLNMCMM